MKSYKKRKPIKRSYIKRKLCAGIKSCKRRSSKISLFNFALKQAEMAWKAAVMRRDKTCRICGSIEVRQADHCFTRSCKQLFLDVRNGTILCRACHSSKTFNVGATNKRVDELVKAREGEAWWEMAKQHADSHIHYKFTIQELEDIKAKLDGMFNEEEN